MGGEDTGAFVGAEPARRGPIGADREGAPASGDESSGSVWGKVKTTTKQIWAFEVWALLPQVSPASRTAGDITSTNTMSLARDS